jgi:DNA-binding XRE family transcriptional regulator
MPVKARSAASGPTTKTDPCEPLTVDARVVRSLMMDDPVRREGMLRAEMTVAGAAFVRSARKIGGFTQAQLAQRIGVTQSRVAQMETIDPERVSPPELLTLARVAHACGRQLKLVLV